MPKPGLLLWSQDDAAWLGPAAAERFEVIVASRDGDVRGLLTARGPGIVATLTTKLDTAWLELLPDLKLIAVPGAGYDGIDVKAVRARGITVANAGNTHSRDVADHAVSLVVASIHRLAELEAWVREGRWTKGSHPAIPRHPQAASAQPPMRHGLYAQRFGIVGLGNIGTCIAERLEPFGGELGWWGPRDHPARWKRHESLLALADWCTVLVIATRGDAVGLVDAKVIEAVGPAGLIVNISRGQVLDEEALIAALKAGRLGSAALDVFDEEPTPPARWADVPHALLTPHVAGVSHESRARLREAALQNLTSALDGTPVVNEVKEER